MGRSQRNACTVKSVVVLGFRHETPTFSTSAGAAPRQRRRMSQRCNSPNAVISRTAIGRSSHGVPDHRYPSAAAMPRLTKPPTRINQLLRRASRSWIRTRFRKKRYTHAAATIERRAEATGDRSNAIKPFRSTSFQWQFSLCPVGSPRYPGCLRVPTSHYDRHRQPRGAALLEHQPVARGQSILAECQPAQGIAHKGICAGKVDRQVSARQSQAALQTDFQGVQVIRVTRAVGQTRRPGRSVLCAGGNSWRRGSRR